MIVLTVTNFKYKRRNDLKSILFSLILTLVAFGGVFAQSTGKTDVAVGYQFTRQDVKFDQSPVLSFDENTDSHGFYVNGAYYPGTKGVLGITGDVGVSIDNREANLVTAMGGLTLKARNNKYFQTLIVRMSLIQRILLQLSHLAGVRTLSLGQIVKSSFSLVQTT
jgi:hypothetical protein